jgi:hypothetical protein
VTGALHFEVHPCAAHALLIDPLPAGANRENALFPDGGHVTQLKEVREILYNMQRPAIAPNVSHQVLSLVQSLMWPVVPLAGLSPRLVRFPFYKCIIPSLADC